MLFTTLTFLLFFAVLYLVYWSVTGRARLYLMLIASIAFYATWSIAFAIHFLAIVAINYAFMRALMKPTDSDRRRRTLLLSAVTLNFANLFLFKYFYLLLVFLHDLTGANAFEREIFNNWLFQHTGYDSLVLPLAISFYTFQLTAYIVDVYRGKITDRASPLEFFVFILFFPQLVAGPIMRHPDFMPQLTRIQPDHGRMERGVWLVLLGLIKKVLIADNATTAINVIFQNPDQFDWSSNLVAIFGYSMRVYCDFSGYTDMARGLGLLLGLELPENFHAPFLSTSMRDMWQRWHVTLATWLRDYLYIPLGGSRTGPVRSYINLIITFTLGGLWHGANYTFVLWGFYHGVLLAGERLLVGFLERRAERAGSLMAGIAARVQRFANHAIGRPVITGLQYSVTFFLFSLGCIPFNAPDIFKAGDMAANIFSGAAGQVSDNNMYLIALIVVHFVFHWIQKRERWPEIGLAWRYTLLGLLGLVTTILLGRFPPGVQEYIYFQF